MRQEDGVDKRRFGADEEALYGGAVEFRRGFHHLGVGVERRAGVEDEAGVAGGCFDATATYLMRASMDYESHLPPQANEENMALPSKQGRE
jgi:hypothetical protein